MALCLREESAITAREMKAAESGGSSYSSHPAQSHPTVGRGERVVESGLVYMDDWSPELFEQLRDAEEA